MTHLDKQQAVDFFAIYYGGEHHFPNPVKECGFGWSITDTKSMASYDFNELTKLVVLAHDRCLRVEISPRGMNRYVIAVHKRERGGGMMERHPTLEEHIEYVRKANKILEERYVS